MRGTLTLLGLALSCALAPRSASAVPFVASHERFLSELQFHELIGYRPQEEVPHLAFREIFWVINTNQHEEQAGMIEIAEKTWAKSIWNKIYLTDKNITGVLPHHQEEFSPDNYPTIND